MGDLSRILAEANDDSQRQPDELLPLVYDELRQLAAFKMAQEKPGQTLSATALVHEAYLRVAPQGDQPKWDGRRHFFAAAAEAMRRILIEKARRKQAQRHGGELERVDANLDAIEGPNEGVDLLALDEALSRLAEESPIRAELVKLRFFAGLSMPECAETLGISLATAERYWTYARTKLFADLQD
jgi:RNA polymerase sigma factor (TIGR02999 family)